LPTHVTSIETGSRNATSQVRALCPVLSRFISRVSISRLDATLISVNLLVLVAAVLVLPRWGTESEGRMQTETQPLVADALTQAAVLAAEPAAVVLAAEPAAPTESNTTSIPTIPAVIPAALPLGPAQVEAEAVKTSAANAEEQAIPGYASRPAVIHLTALAMRRAQGCHPRGHAVGTAQVFVTFDPKGMVSAARLEGEPLASAPVSRCILDHARAIRIPRFHGEPFTYSESVTLR
jgi:hypothetical protein